MLVCICFFAVGNLLTISPVAGAPGSSSGPLLKMGSGARADSLAGSVTAIGEDVFDAQWNPATLAQIRSAQIGLSYNRWVDSVAQQSLALASPLGGAGTFSIAANRLATGDFQGFDAQGTPTGSLDSGSWLAALSWGRSLKANADSRDGLMAGMSIKRLEEDNAGVRAGSLAADAGILYRPGDRLSELAGEWSRRLSAGVALRHLGKGLKFDRETSPLPVEPSAGLGYAHFFKGDYMTIGADFRRLSDGDAVGSFGLEYWHRDFFVLRGGFQTGSDAGQGLRFGAGIRIHSLQLDYAWTGMGDDLGDTHRASLVWRWSVRRRDTALAVAGDLYSFYKERAKTSADRQLYDQAVLDYNRALEIKPDDTDALDGLMRAGERMENSQ